MNETLPPEPLRGLAQYSHSYTLSEICMIVLLVGSSLFVSILCYFKWIKPYLQKKSLPTEEPKLRTIERTLNQLNPEEPFDLAEQKRFYFELSFVFRQLIEEKYSFPATHLTLKELREPLLNSLTASVEKNEVMDFFQFSDMVKFADSNVTIDQARLSYNQVLGWAKKIMNEDLSPLDLPNDMTDKDSNRDSLSDKKDNI